MSLKIRLSRGGTKKRPHYTIVVADSRSPRDGRFIERLGYYDPMLPKDHANHLKLDVEKAQSWMKKGATPSDRVHRFLHAAGVMPPLKRNNPEQAKPRAERRAAAAAKAAAVVAAGVKPPLKRDNPEQAKPRANRAKRRAAAAAEAATAS